MTVTHPETRGDDGVVCIGDAHREGSLCSDSAEMAHGADLGSRFLLLREEGTPQGGIVSPLLANIYVHRFDAWYYDHYGMPDVRTDAAKRSAWQRARRKGKNKAATQMFRYADDWIIAIRGTRAQAQEIKEEGKRFLQEALGLELSEEKTVITHIIDGFDCLG